MDGRPSRIPAVLLAVYIVVWLALAIDPRDRLIWVFENLLVVLAVSALVLTHSWFAFSDRSYAAMFAFLVLHAVGAHYGYTQVPLPWEEWGFARNHSDRVVHFAFGLLATVPVEEALRRGARPRGGTWGLTVGGVLAMAALFEILEWLAVVVGSEATGPTEGGYLGTQGDGFDAIKDMAMALGGSVLTATLGALALRRGPTAS